MADDTITLTLKVKQDGKGFKLVGQNAEKAAKGLEKTAKGARNTDRNLRGAAGMSSNTTKNFSKMQQGISGGLVPAYATLAANVFAVTAAFNLLARNNAVDKLIEGLEFTGNAAGRNLGLLSEKLKEITDGAISAEQAMRTTAVGVSAGFSEAQLEGLAKVAKGASLALGRDLADAMDRLTRGAAKLEPEILDELGIMVRLDDATENFASALGKNVNELTQFERRMAFTNAIIDQGTKKFAAIAEEVDASPFSKLSAAFTDLTKTGVSLLNRFLTPVVGFFAENTMALATVILAFGASISKTLVASLAETAKAAADAADGMKHVADAQVAGLKPAKHMGKAFNRVAESIQDVDDVTEKSIKTMEKSAKMTVNMMNKSNPAYKSAVKTRRQLTLAVLNGEIANHKHTASQAIGQLQTHGFTFALATHKTATQGVTAATAAAASGTDFFTGALIRLKGGLAVASMNLKFFGAAFITYLPHIMAVFAVLSIIVPLVSKLFTEKEDRLSKQLEENTERFEKFSDVVSQYTKTIKGAADANQAWALTIKPLSGLFSQVTAAISDTLIAAEVDQIMQLAELRAKVNKQAEDQQALAEGRQMTGGAGVRSRQGLGDLFKGLSRMLTKGALEETGQGISEADIQTIVGEADKGLRQLLKTSIAMGMALEKGDFEFLPKDAQNLIANSTDIVTGFVDELAQIKKLPLNERKTAIEALLKSITTQEVKLKSASDAFENFGESIKTARELTKPQKDEFGLFAEEIKGTEIALNSLKSMVAGSGEEIADLRANLFLKEFQGLGAEGGVKELEEFLTLLKLINTEEKRLAAIRRDRDMDQTFTTNLVSRLELSERELLLLEEEYTQRTRIVQVLAAQNDESERLRQEQEKQNEINKKINAVLIERRNILAQLAKEGGGMPDSMIALLAGQGAVEAATTNEQADAERFKNTLAFFKELHKEIKAIGPEGETFSAVIEGALNIQNAFQVAFEAIGDTTMDMSVRIQAGLGAITSALGAFRSIQKAANDARIREIDNEIKREKNRDGTSAQSVAKLAALEKKKEQMKRKAFEQDKKMKLAQAVMATSQAAVQAAAAPPGLPYTLPFVALAIAMGAQMISAIQSSTFAGSSGAPSAPAAISIGNRSNSVDLARARSPSGELAFARGERGTGSGMTNFTPAFYGKKMSRATGGYVVGEQGPELFMPEMPGEIIPAGQGRGAVTNVNFSINTVDSRGVEDLLMNQRGNIISMIRESANANGELFLENVNTNAMEMR